MWGMEQPTVEDNLKLIKEAGFDGVEMQVPCDSAERNRLGSLLNEVWLDLVAQVRAEGSAVDEQIESLEKELNRAMGLNTLLTNVHCGKDYWPLAEKIRVISITQKLASELGIGVGISSGANFIGALMVQNELGSDTVVVTVFPDDNKNFRVPLSNLFPERK